MPPTRGERATRGLGKRTPARRPEGQTTQAPAIQPEATPAPAPGEAPVVERPAPPAAVPTRGPASPCVPSDFLARHSALICAPVSLLAVPVAITGQPWLLPVPRLRILSGSRGSGPRCSTSSEAEANKAA